jgi:DNA-3-methyladenine glycosylase
VRTAERPLPRAFYERPVLEVARALLGKVLVTNHADGMTTGRIVEAEAYAGLADPASHAVRLRRSRERMGGPAGLAYVHLSHGLHNTLNIVTEPEGSPTGVLIRAAEPIEGVEVMRLRRGTTASVPDARLASGPGNLAKAFGITLLDDGRDLTNDPDFFITDGSDCRLILASPRIGLTKAAEVPWRFFDGTSTSVSAHGRGVGVT